MTSFSNDVFWGITGVLLLPAAVVCLEIAASFLPRKRRRFDPSLRRPRVAVLIPAHNEARGIGRTLASIRPQLTPTDRLLVVSDNCTDDTAAVARSGAAEVVERRDETLRGKGYAIDAGIRALATDPPAVVVLVDADVTVRDGTIDSLARQVDQTGRPAQGLYVLRTTARHDVLENADGGGGGGGGDAREGQVSHLAFVIRNRIRPLGLARLGGPCPLFGAGIALPWPAVRDARTATGNIVEDVALGLDLAASGHAPLLCAEAAIDGALPRGRAAAGTQRRRWAHGHLRAIVELVPRTLAAGVVHLRPHAVMLALDLLVPPLSFYALLLVLAGAAAFVAETAIGDRHEWSFILWAGAVVLVAFVLLAWVRVSPRGTVMRSLAGIPTYVARRIPMYLAFFGNAERRWTRTARETPQFEDDVTDVEPSFTSVR